MRCLFAVVSLILSSCTFYKLNTYSILDSIGREEIFIENRYHSYCSISESNEILYVKVPVRFISPPSALITATCPFVDGGGDWRNWWSFPAYRVDTTDKEMTYLYFPLNKKGVQTINQHNRLSLTYKNYLPNVYTIDEFEKMPNRLVSKNVKIGSVLSVIDQTETLNKTSAIHYFFKPFSYVAWGVDTISIIPCCMIGWITYDIPYILTH